ASTWRTQRVLGLRAGDRIAFRPPLGAVLAAWGTPEIEQRGGCEVTTTKTRPVSEAVAFAATWFRTLPRRLSIERFRQLDPLAGDRPDRAGHAAVAGFAERSASPCLPLPLHDVQRARPVRPGGVGKQDVRVPVPLPWCVGVPRGTVRAVDREHVAPR